MEVYRTDLDQQKSADQPAGSLDEKAAAKFLGCCCRKLLEMRKAGTAPPHYRIGNRVRYPTHLLVEWMTAQTTQAVAVWPRRKPQADGGVA
jgi:hypothetical protein